MGGNRQKKGSAPRDTCDPILAPAEALGPMTKQLAEAVVPVAVGIVRFPETLKASLLVMANHGWFLVSSMPPSAAFEVAAALSENRVDYADSLMCAYAEEDFEHVLSDIRRVFPHRAAIVEKALSAHTSLDYELSMPVLLAQADGMAKERLRAGLYAKTRANRKLPAVAELRDPVDAALSKLDWNEEWVYASLVDPLRHLWPFGRCPPLPRICRKARRSLIGTRFSMARGRTTPTGS